MTWPSWECQELTTAMQHPSPTPAPLRTYSWACHPQWAGLAANPSTKYYPTVDNVSRYGFAPILKLFYFENLLYATEKEMAPHSRTLAWKIPWMKKPGGLQSMGSLRVGHDWATSLSLFTFTHWRRKWQPLQCSCLENPRDGGAWWAAVCGVAQSRTRLKRLSSSSGTGRQAQYPVYMIVLNLNNSVKWFHCHPWFSAKEVEAHRDPKPSKQTELGFKLRLV